MTPEREKIAEKFNELVLKMNAVGNAAGFTKIERMIWVVIVLRCEIDMEGFSSVFEQALTRAELLESIGYLRELELFETAELFENALRILDSNGFYDEDGQPSASFYQSHQELPNEIGIIGDKIQEKDILWDVDDKLVKLLDLEGTP